MSIWILNTLTVRSGKGDKDRTTILPAAVKDQFKNHLIVKSFHECDLPWGYGEVYLMLSDGESGEGTLRDVPSP
jgi:hypothetical protein